MFKVTARAVLELGSELISSDIIAFYELIKNGFDAGSERGVEISFDIVLGRRAFKQFKRELENDPASYQTIRSRIEKSLNSDAGQLYDAAIETLNGAQSATKLHDGLDEIYESNSISVSDTGSGMSFDDLERVFLVIGTPSRKTAVDEALKNKSKSIPFLGEKGIGRLSAMRLGEKLEVRSAKTDDKRLNILDIDWSEFGELDAMLEDIPVSPREGGKKLTKDWSGTRITIRNLEADWTRRRLEELAIEEFSTRIPQVM